MSRKQPEPKKSYLPFVIIGGVLAVAIVAALLLMRTGGDSGSTANTQNPTPAKNSASAGATPGAASPTPATRFEQPGAPSPNAVGPANAPVVLEEFSDFQCPACARLHPSLKKIEDDYGSRVRVVFRHFPLQQMHKNAFSAARAAEAAGLQGKFWEMHDRLFETQNEWKDSPEPRPLFAMFASRLGLNVEKFRADMERQDIADRVRADYNRGMSLGVGGTPTIFLNGRELPAEQTLADANLRAQIDSELARKGVK
ncbi:MAG TPA: DsbA family protein [Pyrinomonadaceae bacterium]|nr:DsbA family protein [Pyrinomonadaceae bacterium]